ncbi:calcium/sodium antiporter [Patescibacteria group bacterium]|nr:calcium/sodium antiporter [Patescibacteria group bacterium]
MWLNYVLLIVGFVILIKAADMLVDGSSSIAKKFGISSLMIGLTIVAFGTSAPELVVNILSSLNGNSEIAIGNILGSNISNVLLILGITALVYPLKVSKGTTWKEIPLSLLGSLALLFAANDQLIDGGPFSALSRIDGILFLFFFVVFIYYTFGIAKVAGKVEEDKKVKKRSMPSSIIFILIGMFGLFLGGKWVVDSAVAIAQNFGLSESLVGLTVVAIGTSLPELATSVMAALRKNADIAVGNIVGSNIFNVFWILGVSAVIKPLPFNPSINLDMIVAILAIVILFVTLFFGKKRMIERWQGALFVGSYVAYVVFLVIRG